MSADVTPEQRDVWPCDNYLAPLTCWTTPKGKTLPCEGCRAAFPNGPEVQALYAAALPAPEDGCACTYHPGNYPIEPPDVEYEPACPVHSEHLYDPRAGMWVRRSDALNPTERPSP